MKNEEMNVKIRRLQVTDALTSWRWRNNPEIWAFTGTKPSKAITISDEISWIEKVIKDQNSIRFAILVNETCYVGNVQLTDIIGDSAQFHMFIGEQDYWGKGVGRLATLELLRWVSSHTKISRIWLMVNKNNDRAVRLYARVGFQISSLNNSDNFFQMCHIINR